MYRELNPNELSKVAQQLNEMAIWYAYKAFADKYFPLAVSLSVEIEGESDDEGGTDYRITGIYGTDKDGDSISLSDEVLRNYDKDKYNLPTDHYEPSEINLLNKPGGKFHIVVEDN